MVVQWIGMGLSQSHRSNHSEDVVINLIVIFGVAVPGALLVQHHLVRQRITAPAFA
jgi:hypothetical protein